MYPTNRVIGTVADDGKAKAAIDALLRGGFARECIDLLHSEEDLKRPHGPGNEHGFLAQFQRTLHALEHEERKHLTHHIEDVRAGRYLIMVLTKRRVQRILAADILHQFGAEFVGFYGRWAWEGLPAHPHRSPQDIPALFVRAWNDRDPDALASLFDEDAQFVNVSGVCWQDRESIRKAHAQGLKRIVNKSTLTIDEMKVKLLAPDVAVVHTRMTLSGQTPARSTIVSFVVHRTVVDWWQCASAHNTDVVPVLETNVIDEAGMSGFANYPSGPAS